MVAVGRWSLFGGGRWLRFDCRRKHGIILSHKFKNLSTSKLPNNIIIYVIGTLEKCSNHFVGNLIRIER
jgi:hypothetical protein